MEYITGFQTLQAYHISGTKYKKLTSVLKDYSNMSYRYEVAGIPV